MRNIISIDIEEFFQAEYVRYHLEKKNFSYRTPDNIGFILELLREKDVNATFFIVGEIAEKFPEIITMIMKEGHEVAFHGWSHLSLMKLNPNLFQQEIIKFKKVCPSCIGYRAPSFSLNNKTKWMLEILRSEGFHYDSSVFPVWTPLYGVYRAPIKPYNPSLDDITKEDRNNQIIHEFPLACYNFLGIKIPIAGGFWLRFWNMDILKRGIRKLNKSGVPAVIFFHNWELDPETPKLKLGFHRSFVTYHNINKTANRVRALLSEINFTSFREYLEIEGFV